MKKAATHPGRQVMGESERDPGQPTPGPTVHLCAALATPVPGPDEDLQSSSQRLTFAS